MSEAVRLENLSVLEGEHVLIQGAEGAARRALMRRIAGMGPSGVCLREPALLPGLTLWENVALPLVIRGENTARQKKAAWESLEALGIDYAAHALPASLSPWESALAALARSVVAKPALLLMEEPAADLNEGQAGRFFALLEGLREYREATALMFASRELPLRFDRRYTIQYGGIREENP